jgi:DNA-binding PadR family transcriptional regulator
MKDAPLTGHLDAMILAAVSRVPRHGYAIVEHLRERSRGAFDLPEGTVYPALYRLERGGVLKSRWTVHAGRRRRMYELTAKGRTMLETRRAWWESFSRGVSSILHA